MWRPYRVGARQPRIFHRPAGSGSWGHCAVSPVPAGLGAGPGSLHPVHRSCPPGRPTWRPHRSAQTQPPPAAMARPARQRADRPAARSPPRGARDRRLLPRLAAHPSGAWCRVGPIGRRRSPQTTALSRQRRGRAEAWSPGAWQASAAGLPETQPPAPAVCLALRLRRAQRAGAVWRLACRRPAIW